MSNICLLSASILRPAGDNLPEGSKPAGHFPFRGLDPYPRVSCYPQRVNPTRSYPPGPLRAMNTKSMDEPSSCRAFPNKCSRLSQPLGTPLSITIIPRPRVKNGFLPRFGHTYRLCCSMPSITGLVLPNDSVGRQQYPLSRVGHVRKYNSLVSRFEFTILHHRSCYRRQHLFIGL